MVKDGSLPHVSMSVENDSRGAVRATILATLVAVGSLFLAVSLASYDAGDPPTTYVYPPRSQVNNWCGPVGALLAATLVHGFSYCSWILVLVGGVTACRVACRRPRSEYWGVAVGFVLLLFTGSGLAHRGPATSAYCSVHGPGGAAGALVAPFLEQWVSPVGSFLLLAPLFIAGFVLAFGEPARRLALRIGSLVLMGVARFKAGLKRRIELAAIQKVEVPARRDVGIIPLKIDLPELPALAPEVPVVEKRGPKEHPQQELRIVRTGFQEEAAIESEAPYSAVEEDHGPAPVVPSAVKLPEQDILDDPEPFEFGDHEQEIRDRAKLLEKTLAQFQMAVQVVQIDTGPVVTQYEIELEAGLRARKVMAMADDLAIAMRAPNVRIVAPIPGKNTVGIEVPNERRAKVGLKEVMTKSNANGQRLRLPLFLGKDVKGQPLVCDLASMPHLLIAGRTGTGKSVCLNTLILSILMTRTPDQVKMLMIDPKMVELSLYKNIPHLLHPVVTDMKKAEALLGWAVEKMEERYSLLARAGVRHIESYNKLTPEEIYSRLGLTSDEDKAHVPTHIPYILVFADEMADLMMTAAKEVEGHIIRLAQKSRAVGIHLVLATQKPTVDVITGLIKSNLPARIAFQVASRSDSRVVLDEMGADKLLGNGDMLFLFPGTSKILRAQGTFVSDEEVMRVVDYLSSQAKPQFSSELIGLQSSSSKDAAGEKDLGARDELYEQAIDVVVREGRGSVSLLQRALGIGYGRGARLIDYMAEDGIVGEYNGSQAREVLYSPEDWENAKRAHFGRAS